MGKTWVAAHLATTLRAGGTRVAARKPAQSFDPSDPHPTDAQVLAEATGETPHEVCAAHRWLPVALAPPMAAQVLGLPKFTIAELIDEIIWPANTEIGIIEGAGGIHSPIADDGDTLTLLDGIQPDLVIVVAEPHLGSINNIRLTTAALQAHNLIVYLNRFDPTNTLHQVNLSWMTDRCKFKIAISESDLVHSVQSVQSV